MGDNYRPVLYKIDTSGVEIIYQKPFGGILPLSSVYRYAWELYQYSVDHVPSPNGN